MKKVTIIVISLVFGLLAACQSAETPQTLEDVALFTDADIDDAIQLEQPDTAPIEPTDIGEIADGVELADLPDLDEGELSSQAVFPNVAGFAYYIRHNPTLNYPYSVYKHDQSNDVKTNIYTGEREIQSVAGDYLGRYVYMSMKQSEDGHFHVYRLSLESGVVTQVSFLLMDNINVSSSPTGRFIAFQSTNGSSSTVHWYRFSPGSFNILDYKGFSNYREPSISSSGTNIAAVRDLPNGKDRVAVLKPSDHSAVTITTSSKPISHPSLSHYGSVVMWLQDHGTRLRVRMKNTISGDIQTVLSSKKDIDHPYIERKGNYMTYSFERNGHMSIYQKNLTTGQRKVINAGSGNNHYIAPSWNGWY